MKKKLQIAVIGSAGKEEYLYGGLNFEKIYSIAYNIGKGLAEKGCIVINGGKTGIMEAVSKGAKDGGGITVGVIKGNQRFLSNQYIDVEIVTNMGDGGDAFMIPMMSDACIMIGGGVGTLKEVSGFYLANKPIVSIIGSGGWADRLSGEYIDERKIRKIEGYESVDDAINYILSITKKDD